MITSLLNYLRAHGHTGDALSYILPRMIKGLGAEFRVFTDCGAGIGHTAQTYRTMLEKNLAPEVLSGAAIHCYEPLPENIKELTPRLAAIPGAVLHTAAVGEKAGRSSFVVPRRMTGKAAAWGEGTSAVGYLGQASGGDIIDVEVVSLEHEPISRFDFVKLDLQGGERAALKGMGSRLQQAKLIYAEHQLLALPEYGALELLMKSGFVCFFDRLQFGIKTGSRELPLALFQEAGITMDRLLAPDGRGMSNDYMLYGYMDGFKTTHLSPAGFLHPDMIKRLREAGVFYLQTDILAVNSTIYHDFLRLL